MLMRDTQSMHTNIYLMIVCPCHVVHACLPACQPACPPVCLARFPAPHPQKASLAQEEP